MWKRGGRSSALDRAQALLSAKRSSRGDVEPVQRSTVTLHTGDVGGSVKSASPNTHPLFSDLSDLSSVSSAPEHGAETLGFAAAGKTQGRGRHSTKDLRPQSSLGGGGSQFLKRAPPPATSSSQSPVSKQHSSQTAALSRLAQIESRIHSRKQGQEQQARERPKPAENLTSDIEISPPTTAQSLEAPVQLSAQSSSDQNLKAKSFLKNKTPVAVNSSRTAAAAAARSSKGTDIGVRSRSRAAEDIIPSATLEMKSVRVVSGVSLESDEEDMRKLLGDSLDSIDNGFLMPGRHSSIRSAGKMLSKMSQKVCSPPPPAAVPPSSSAPPRSPASPSHRSSPLRFTSQSQAHFSPSVLSPPPSPPRVTLSPPGRLETPHRVGSPPLSSMSGHGEVLSLEELFSVGPGCEDPHSEMSAVTSEDFKINVMTLDDLVPATLGFTEETPGKETEAKHSAPLPGSHNRHQQQSRLKEKEKKEDQQQEDVVNYESDFESESRTEPDYSVSEHLHGDGDEEEVESEVREEASDSDMTRGRTEEDYSSTFKDTSRSCNSRRDCSQTLSRSRDSRSSVSHDSRTFSRQSRRRASTRKALKEAAVQTQSDPLAYTRPAGMTYTDPTPMVVHTLSAETLEVLSTFNPAVFALNEMLKQQLAMTRRFVESSQHLHSSLVQSLGPPNYRYTTLEDTKEYIRKNRPPKLTMEEALEEVLQEMRDYHHI